MKFRQKAAAWAFVLLLGAVPVSVYATEETRQQIKDAEQEKKNTESQLGETKENLDALNEQKDSLEGTLSNLNTELQQVGNNLSALEGRIAEKEAEIDETSQMIEVANQELKEAIAVKEEQYENMKLQIKFLYEESDSLYLEMIFSAESYAELLNRSDYIEQLSAYEQKTLQEYKDTQARIEGIAAELEMAKAQLENDKNELDNYKVQVVAEQSRVSGLVSQASNSLAVTSDEISDAEAAAAAYEQQLKEQEENLAALRAKLAEEIRMAELAAQSSWRDISEVSFAEGDRYLLANLIYCEAGAEPYSGQVAVGSVVMNRVLSSVYPDTIVGVIYQSGQFSPVASGRLALALAEGRANENCYRAADEVMSGTTNVGNCVYFRTPIEGVTPRYTIGGHIFY
ncbi:MAG: cell wall hydrolase [Blautia sp.]|nr:cell wall hydrolase [Blautia sp.]MCM1202361.1 cell wall hydrolase [Bacteroides fragilis]